VIVRDLRALLRELRLRHPALLPVVVRRRALLRYRGYTTLCRSRDDGSPSHFRVVLHDPMSSRETRDTLLHEWAHCLSWHEGETVCDHDPEWAVAYGRLYQELIEP